MTTPQDDPELVRGLQSGDADAWRALYDMYSVRVWRYVSRLIGADSQSVADVVQETLMAAARSVDRFDPNRGTLWSWLSGIAHKQTALHWRRVAVRRVDPAEPSFDDSPSGGDAPERAMEQSESLEVVRRVLAELPDEYATLLIAKYSDGDSVATIVDRYGSTTEAVRSKLARARREFRRRIEKKCLMTRDE